MTKVRAWYMGNRH